MAQKQVKIALITGSLGLVGQSCVKKCKALGLSVIGIDNNARSKYFGTEEPQDGEQHELYRIDIRDRKSVAGVFKKHSEGIGLIIHAAAQPSHDWSAKNPLEDFEINCGATAYLLEQTRQRCPEAVFIYVSTSKVYGDLVNYFNYFEQEKRFEPGPLCANRYHTGISEEPLSVSTRSPFGANKAAADIIAQEYGRYYGMKVGIFRPGCITGKAHRGAELHGFLAYLAQCVKEDKPYMIFGYGGKQVRDNIHADDLADAFIEFYKSPKPGEVYNIGGGRENSCSVLEAIEAIEKKTGKKLKVHYDKKNRIADHKWWITDNSKFKKDYPAWKITRSLDSIYEELLSYL